MVRTVQPWPPPGPAPGQLPPDTGVTEWTHNTASAALPLVDTAPPPRALGHDWLVAGAGVSCVRLMVSSWRGHGAAVVPAAATRHQSSDTSHFSEHTGEGGHCCCAGDLDTGSVTLVISLVT